MNDAVPFFCPRCGEEVVAKLIYSVIAPDPIMPSLRCPSCDTRWRVNVYEVEEESP